MESFRDHLNRECQRGRNVKRKMIAQAKNIRNKDERQRSLTSAQAYEPPECVQLLDLFGNRKPSSQAAQTSLSRERKLREQQQGVREKDEAATDAPSTSASLKEESSIHGFT